MKGRNLCYFISPNERRLPGMATEEVAPWKRVTVNWTVGTVSLWQAEWDHLGFQGSEDSLIWIISRALGHRGCPWLPGIWLGGADA